MKIIIGAGDKKQNGWISTEQSQLDLLRREDFERLLDGDVGFEAIVMEHVLEHLPCEEITVALTNCYDYLDYDGRLRIAVPDGFHPDPKYIDYVRPGGNGAGAESHQVLLNYRVLGRMLRNIGFRVNYLEWWDRNGLFHANIWNEIDGYIERCLANDPRNRDGEPHYTSLIVDAFKELKDTRDGLTKAFKFVEEYDPYKVSPFNKKKTTTLYELARLASAGGAIVELGSYHGVGTAALWYGSRDGHRCRVIAVDAYTSMKGWIGEPYEPDDMEIWKNNMKRAGIYPTLFRSDVHEASKIWEEPISLLVHDLGSMNRMPRDVMEWEGHVILGGYIALRDLDNFSMGTEQAIRSLISTGRWGNRRNWDGFITSIERIA